VFLADKLQRVADEFLVFDDAQERLAAVVDRAKRAQHLPAGERIEANRVRGCVSVVWLVSELREGRLHFRSDAESPVVRGLVGFLCDFFNGAPAVEVADFAGDPLEAVGLVRDLSPTRRHGLAAVRDAMREFARHCRPPPTPKSPPS
jgi:cysteine desulfuration protein SufE